MLQLQLVKRRAVRAGEEEGHWAYTKGFLGLKKKNKRWNEDTKKDGGRRKKRNGQYKQKCKKKGEEGSIGSNQSDALQEKMGVKKKGGVLGGWLESKPIEK